MGSGPAGDRTRTLVLDGTGNQPSLPDFSPGTNLLLSGPPLIGKNDLLLSTLARGTDRDEASIIVSTRDDEVSVLDDLERVSPGYDRSMVGVVECVSGQETVDTDSIARVRRAGSPADLTGIGIEASELMTDFADAGASGIRLGVDSLSTVLLYTEFDRMCRFLHVLAGRVDRAGGTGVYVVNPGTINDAQFDQLKTLFDGLVELREREDGDREIRVRGLPDVDPDWRPFVVTPE
jgi:KaiC/GvpD/RAD55 family RecA-like ATPase